jgi:integrase
MRSRKRRGAGEGSVRKRPDGRWEGRYTVSWNGARQDRRSVFGSTESEAIRKLREAQRQAETGARPDGTLTVAKLMDQFLATVSQSRKLSTHANYQAVSRAYIVPRLGRRRVSKLSPGEVASWLSDLRSEGLSPSTTRLARTVLRLALEQAKSWGKTPINAAALVPAPKLDRQARRPPNVEAVQQLLALAQGERLGVLFLLSVTTGARRGELLALRWSDVNLDTGEVRIAGTLNYVPRNGLVRSTPKSGRERVVYITTDVTQLLKFHQEQQDKERHSVRWEVSEADYVFTTLTGTPVDPRNLTRIWHRLRGEAGLPVGTHLHDLRHFVATEMLSAGIPLSTISKQLGHSSIRVTADIYAHVEPILLRNAAETLSGVLLSKT